MTYSSTVETLKSALPGIAHAMKSGDEDVLDYKYVLGEVSKGKGAI